MFEAKNPQIPLSILLVEDDHTLRLFLAKFLKDKGYRVLDASNAEAAIEILGAFKNLIDVMVTDVIMPGMSGFELGKIVRVSDPGLAIIYMSGFCEQESIDLQSREFYLAKPFGSTALLQALERVTKN